MKNNKTIFGTFYFKVAFSILAAVTPFLFVSAQPEVLGCSPVVLSDPEIDLTQFDLQPDLSDEFDGPNLKSLWVPSVNVCSADQDIDLLSNIIFTIDTDPVNGQTLSILKLREQAESQPILCPNGGTRNFSSAQIESNQEYLYGYYEIRCKFPSVIRQVIQSFWLWWPWDPNNGYNINKISETDVFEHLSFKEGLANDNEILWIHCHSGDSTNYITCPSLEYIVNTCINLSNNYHTYGFLWTPEKIEFYFDGRPLRQSDSPFSICESTSPCSNGAKPMIDFLAQRVILSNGMWNGLNNTNVPLISDGPIDFNIDYFRYYKKKPEISGASIISKDDDVTYTASMFGINTTSDDYNWQVSTGAKIISISGPELVVRRNLGYTDFTISLTGTESHIWYWNFFIDSIIYGGNDSAIGYDLNHRFWLTTNWTDRVSTQTKTVLIDTSSQINSENFKILPNPTSKNAQLEYFLDHRSFATIDICNSNSQILKRIMDNKELEPGRHSINLDIWDFNAGIYYCTIKIESSNYFEKLIIIK